MKTSILAALAAAVSFGHAEAAVITYSTYVATSATDTSWVLTGPGTGSVNFGTNSATYGGVTFAATASGITTGSSNGFDIYHSIPGFAWATKGSGFYPTSTSTTLLNQATTISGSGVTIDINGLSSATTYLIKMVFTDSRSGASGNSVSLSSNTPNSGSLAATQYAYSDGRYLVVSATFTSPTFATPTGGVSMSQFTNGSPGGILSAVQIVAIPEPATSLLGGLGMLALLRRRRA